MQHWGRTWRPITGWGERGRAPWGFLAGGGERRELESGLGSELSEAPVLHIHLQRKNNGGPGSRNLFRLSQETLSELGSQPRRSLPRPERPPRVKRARFSPAGGGVARSGPSWGQGGHRHQSARDEQNRSECSCLPSQPLPGGSASPPSPPPPAAAPAPAFPRTPDSHGFLVLLQPLSVPFGA